MTIRAHRFRAAPQVESLESRYQPAALTPTYAVTFDDAVTGDNAFLGADGKQYWTVDAGADQYQTDVYERPTAQTFRRVQAADGTRPFAASEYFANLDIAAGRAGFDDNFLYVSVRLAGLTEHGSDGSVDAKGLVYRYGFRIATTADGGGGLLVVADQPGLKNAGGFGGLSTFVYRDSNGDVGGIGRDVTKQDREAEVGGNGYERVVAADGRTPNGRQVVWVRVSPTDPTVVEFALDYKAVGYTADDLRTLPYLEFEANKGLQGPSNYAWNDEYTKSEAGSPYGTATGGLSEFGTQGLGNIYELDTLRGGAIAAPASGRLAGFVFADTNGDAVRDAGDMPLSGVRITLFWFDEQGTYNERETFTDANGAYEFTGLAPGVYNIREEQPPSYESGPNFVGTLGGVVEGDEFRDIVLGPGDEGVNYDFGEFINT